MTLYSGHPEDCLISVPLDGLTALYHRLSAMTHVLVEPAPQILEALRAAPLTLADLRAVLRLSEEDTALLEERLSELEASGLVLRA